MREDEAAGEDVNKRNGGQKSGAQPTRPDADLPSIAAPTLALPKGGGAIRAMGEKLSPNPATGAATFSIPIYVSPSRGGTQPDLALTYSGGGGNGPFGLGSSLSVPSIARRTEKRLPAYDDSDVFVLSGAEDLVPSSFNGIWNDGKRTEGNFLIALYQPRVDKLFARIERWTEQTTGDFYWRAITRDNLVQVYGRSPGARVADPDDPRRVFRWLLESTSDGKGSEIVYRYRAEDGAGIAPAIYEEHRRATAVYLDRVLYGNRASTLDGSPRPDHPEDWLFEVVFDYGERDAQTLPNAPTYAPPAPWRARLDPFSTFKPGFEVRTQRLCRRVLVFHRIDDPLTPVLVRSTDLTYDERADLSFLTGATQTGYDPAQTPSYQQLAPLALSYTAASPDDTVRTLDRDSLANLPSGLDGARHQWVDLDSEGVSGVLTEEGRGWYYKRNEGAARLGAAALVAERPTQASLAVGQQLVDLERDGRRWLVQWAGDGAGAQPRLADGSWGPFVPFRSRPTQDVFDPNARLVDLDGDGRADLLVTEDAALRWYPSLGRDGFGPSEARARTWDEDRAPALVFADAEQTIHLADMTGDGLADLVRIRNGEVCYWPNLGYGRFGAKITMASSPRFDRQDLFDQRRLRLADVDGSGTTDLIYLDGDGARYWINCAGNSFDGGHRLTAFPGYDSATSVDAVDLLGNGTSCLVWSSKLPQNAGRAMRYVALTGGVKPHLLETVDNGRGLTTTISYAASTEFYLADRAAGRPWATRVPFPVQVIKQIDVGDAVSGDRLTTSFAYHHGFYDAVEWEFRGFGMVEQWDAERFDASRPQDVLTVPPIHTKTWFHTGAFLEGPSLSQRFAAEYYGVDGVFSAALADSELENVVTAIDARQAARALAGQVLRREIYAADGAVDGQGNPLAGSPFLVEAHNYHVKALQAATEAEYGIFVVRPRETLSFQLERDPTDPRLTHEVTIAGDDFGNVTERITLAYPRRASKLEGVAGQDRLLATYVRRDFANVADQNDWYRVGVPYESRSWEVRGFENAPTPPDPLTIAQPAFPFAVAVQASQAVPIAFEAAFDATKFQRRLIADTQLRYRDDDGTTELAAGAIASRGLLARTRRLAFDQALLDQVFDASHPLPAGLAASSGYELEAGQYWARSNTASYAAGAFYQANAFTDAFGNSSSASYGTAALFVVSVTDPAGNTMGASYDSRTLQPRLLLDVNGNQSLAAYDPLGRLAALAVQGKPPPTSGAPPAEGDTLPSPTTQFVHHLESIPSYVVRQARETAQYPDHVGQPPDYRYSLTYYDGFGREAMTKVEDDDGLPATQMSTKWVGTGRTVFNNKGKPVRRYEPYFSSNNAFESEPSIVQSGVTDVLSYDPMERLIRTDHPDGTFALVEFDAWTQRTYDENDTLAGHGPNAWWTRYGVTPPTTPQQVAAVNAYEHRDTPMVAKLDVLGRTVDARVTNVEYPGGVRTPVEYPSVTTLDIQGNALATTISNQTADGTLVSLAALTQTFDMLGRVLTLTSSDAGQSWALPDAVGKPVFAQDARATTNPTTPNTSGYRITWLYDALRRPLTRVVRAPGAADAVAEQFTYGEGLSGLTDEHGAPATPQALNLLGRLYQQKDGAGVVTNVRYDLRGNLRYHRRQLIADYANALPDWSTALALDVQVYANAATFDAMSRSLTTTQPDGTVISNSFGKRLLLAAVTVTPNGQAAQPMVTGIDYNEKGQRKQIRYGNGAATTYTYEVLNFRLSTVSTASPGGALQGLTYYYDPVGNIAEVDDAATATVTFNGGEVSPNQTFVYDALYRLTQATGREQIAQTADQDQLYGFNLPAPTQPNAFRGYTENYAWDRLGNVRSMQHAASVGGGFVNNWTRHHETDEANSNRLLSTSASGSEPGPQYSLQYAYDSAGNITRLPHLGGTPGNANCFWNDQNRLVGAALNAAADPVDVTDRAYYSYDADGMRVRKVVVAAGNVKRERRYLGGYEVFQHTSGGAVTERHTVHVMDDKRRVTLVETKTINDGTPVANPQPVFRYQMDNHIGSSMFELDAGGNLISREEYHPFGTTSYYLGPSALLDVGIKRYRYTGRERDDETGLYRMGARYYLPWLGRFLSADPAGYVDGPNLYRYSRDNPIRFSDPSGTDPKDYQLKSQLLFTGIANPLTLPDYPLIPGASNPQTFELVGSQGVNLPLPSSGGSTSLLANYRQRVSRRLDLGVTASYAGQYPWTGGDPTNSNLTGSQLAFFSHFGEVEDEALSQTATGFYLSAGFLWGQGPPGATNATNPFASLTTGASTFRRSKNAQGDTDTDFQLDWNLIFSVARYGNSINNRVTEGTLSGLTVFNFALPGDLNIEAAGGALLGTSRILFNPNNAGSGLVTPFTLRSQLGFGWTHRISGNYVFGIEAILTKDWLPSVLDSSGMRQGPLGLTVNIGVSGVNRPHSPHDEEAALQRFSQERDAALQGGN